MIIPVFSRRALAGLRLDRRRRSSRSASSASACGCTTCSPPGCRRSALVVLLRGQPAHHDPERRAVLRVDRHDVEGQASSSTRPDAVRRRLPADLPARRDHRRDGRRSCRSTGQVTDSYFIVAHFHYVLNGAVVFPIFGAIYYWMPEDDRAGCSTSGWARSASGSMFVGFNLTFFPMHILGVPRHAAPRLDVQQRARLGHAEPDRRASARSCSGSAPASRCSTGSCSLRHGEPAPRRPVGRRHARVGRSTSPPPDYNFAAIPVVASRHPLWDERPAARSRRPATIRATRVARP